MIEWGCDVHAKNSKGLTAFETIKNDEFRDFLIGECHLNLPKINMNKKKSSHLLPNTKYLISVPVETFIACI